MKKLASLVKRQAAGILVVAFCLTAVGVFLSDSIEVVTEARKMLPGDNPQVEAFNRINDTFTTAFFMITVEGGGRHRMIEAAEDIGRQVLSDPEVAPLVKSYDLQTDPDFVREWGLMLQEEEDLEKAVRLLQKRGIPEFLFQFNDNLEDTYSGDDGQNEVDTSWEEIETASFLATKGRAAKLMEDSLESQESQGGSATTEQTAEELANMFLFGDLYNFDRSGEMLVVGVTPDFTSLEMEKGNQLTAGIRRILAKTESRYPDLTFGYGGDVAQNADEELAISNDLFWPTLVALFVILVLFVFAFDRARDVVFALIALAVGILGTVGYIALSLGEINLITSSFGVLLVGLGIDFGIHFISNFDDFRRRGMETGAALLATYETVGMAIVVAAITTAVSFLSLLLTDSEVIRQFGIVAGGGILITLIAMLTVLPALLVLFTGPATVTRRLPVIRFGWMELLGSFCGRARLPVIAAFLALTVGASLMIPKNSFLYDLTKLGPQESTSVVTQRKVEKRMGYSPYPVMYADSDIASIRSITDELEDERMVAAVSSISQFIAPPDEQRARLSIIEEARVARNLSGSPAPITEENLEDLTFEIQRLEWNMIEIGDVSVAALGEGNMIHRQRDEMIREIMGAEVGKPGEEVFQSLISRIESDPEAAISRLNELQVHFAQAIDERAQTLLSPRRPITAADLPDDIRGQLVSDDGSSYLVTVLPNTEVADQEGLFRFCERTEEITPEITGMVPIAIEFSQSIIDEVSTATAYIAAALLLILLLTFRHLSYTLVISAGIVVAVALMFGLFPLAGMQLNVLSVMVLPLIFGLGIGYFIHVTHRYRQEGAVGPALRYTGKGVFLSAATTMIAFGSLGLVGEFRALQLLGQMLFVGIGVVVVTSVTMLPAILGFFGTGEKEDSNELNTRTQDAEPSV